MAVSRQLDLKKLFDITSNITLLDFLRNYFLTSTKNYLLCIAASASPRMHSDVIAEMTTFDDCDIENVDLNLILT